jgi:hypothetical protein
LGDLAFNGRWPAHGGADAADAAATSSAEVDGASGAWTTRTSIPRIAQTGE